MRLAHFLQFYSRTTLVRVLQPTSLEHRDDILNMIGTRLSCVLPALLIVSLLSFTVGQKPIRINCGGQTRTDRSGNQWLSDRYFNQGSQDYSTSSGISGTIDDWLYQSERWRSASEGPMRYEIPISNGEVEVRLLFAENYISKSGQRVFDVKVEGTVVYRNLDVFDKVGKNRKWDSPVHRATVRDGKLTIEFIAKEGNPKIGAIEVIPIELNDASSARNGNIQGDIRYEATVKYTGIPPMGLSWADSYSVGDRCYCDGLTTYDHEIKDFYVNTPLGWKTVEQVCKLLGPGPGRQGRPIYNDIQCGNGPPNTAGDEHTCPGRVDLGVDGCNQIGPKWNFSGLPQQPERRRFFLDAGGPTDQPSLITSGKSWTYNASGKSIKIKNNLDIPETVYETHRSAPILEYKIGDFEAATPYKVSLGFAEVWGPNCSKGKRVMVVRINGNLYENSLDVFDRTKECGGALVESYILPANGRGEFVVNISASVENAMLSSIDIIPIS